MMNLYHIPRGKNRGKHANIKKEQILIAMSGSFDVVTNNGFEQNTYNMNCNYKGLYIPRMTWLELENFSLGAVCMILSSDFYNSEDYIRDFENFVNLVRQEKN